MSTHFQQGLLRERFLDRQRTLPRSNSVVLIPEDMLFHSVETLSVSPPDHTHVQNQPISTVRYLKKQKSAYLEEVFRIDVSLTRRS